MIGSIHRFSTSLRLAVLGGPRLGTARHGTTFAARGSAMHCMAWLGTVGLGSAWLGKAWHGTVFAAMHGDPVHGLAWHGLAGQGMASLGKEVV